VAPFWARALAPFYLHIAMLAYLKSKGLCGHPQASITELAQEHGLDKTTMYRWVNAGELLIREKGAQLGLDIKSFQ